MARTADEPFAPTFYQQQLPTNTLSQLLQPIADVIDTKRTATGKALTLVNYLH
jgi:hypothetical protein